jgi:hypothetical protein
LSKKKIQQTTAVVVAIREKKFHRCTFPPWPIAARQKKNRSRPRHADRSKRVKLIEVLPRARSATSPRRRCSVVWERELSDRYGKNKRPSPRVPTRTDASVLERGRTRLLSIAPGAISVDSSIEWAGPSGLAPLPHARLEHSPGSLDLRPSPWSSEHILQFIACVLGIGSSIWIGFLRGVWSAVWNKFLRNFFWVTDKCIPAIFRYGFIKACPFD